MAKCDNCNKLLNKKSAVLECSRCQKLVHATSLCSGLTAKQLGALRAAENLEWTCNNCNQNISRRKSIVAMSESEEEERDMGKLAEGSIDIKKLLQDLKKEVSNIVTQEMRAVSTAVQYCSEKVDEFAESLDALTGKLRDMEKKVLHLDNQNKHLQLKVESLEQRNYQIEQQLLADHVEISGIPESSDLDLPKLVENLVEKLAVPKEDVISVKRLGARRNGPGPVLVRVRQECIRQRLITAARDTTIIAKDFMPNITGPPATEKIFVREALTPYLKNLLWQAKQDLKGVYKFVWIREGKILVRKNETAKVYTLRSKSDIQSLQSTGN